MEVIELENWEAFEEKIEEDLKKAEPSDPEIHTYTSDLLFRGHARESWSLATTLERFSKEKKCVTQEYSWNNYFRILHAVAPAISSMTSNKYELLEEFKIDTIIGPPPGYEFMIYLRHHGFPSPLLDWTRSPYVAAFFAFKEATESENVAIFSFREYLDGGKTTLVSVPHIVGTGPYAKTHKRHYQQQCEYTICFKIIDGNYIYCSHGDAEFRKDQDILKKYVIPSTERKKVLGKLHLMNINAYSLFGSEESLINMLAYQEVERKW